MTAISGVKLAARAQPVDLYLDDDGRVERMQVTGSWTGRWLFPHLVDLHLDVLRERRHPRATVELGIPETLLDLDAECAGAGIGVVCVAARFEDEPGKGIRLEDALRLCRAVDDLAPFTLVDWRVHARVEVTDDGVVEALTEALSISGRIALISVMEHSFEKSRFASAEEHRKFYAQDWGVPGDQVDAMMARKRRTGADKEGRREQVARLARSRAITLASHDDGSVEEVNRALELGATVCEFPLTLAAGQRAASSGMLTVMGAPNALRGRSTSSGNLLVSDAVRAGICGALCSDYLPHSMMGAVFALSHQGVAGLDRMVQMASAAPAAAIGLVPPRIEVGELLDAALVQCPNRLPVVTGLWRAGRQVMARAGSSSPECIMKAYN